MKDKILDILNSRLGIDSDNLNRAKVAFKQFTVEQMKEGHGHSGHSRAQILNTYKDSVSDVESMIKWLKESV